MLAIGTPILSASLCSRSISSSGRRIVVCIRAMLASFRGLLLALSVVACLVTFKVKKYVQYYPL